MFYHVLFLLLCIYYFCVHLLLLFICSSDPQAVSLENYPIHIIAGLVKQWLRELPDPLMTYRLYNDFLYAAGELMVMCIFSMKCNPF